MSIHVSYLVERGVKGLLPFCLFAFLPFDVNAQDVIVNPDISYAGTPRQCEIGGITVKGVEGYEDYVLIGLSGLSVGQRISVPGTEITEAVKRYWKHGLFSKAAITADSLVGSKVYLCIHLWRQKPPPRRASSLQALPALLRDPGGSSEVSRFSQ